MKTTTENHKRRRSSESTSEISEDNQGNENSRKSRKTTVPRKSIGKDTDAAAVAIPNYLKSTSSSSRKQKPMNPIDSADVLSASSNSDMEKDGSNEGGIVSGPLTSAHKQLLQQQWVIEANSHRQQLPPVDENKGETEGETEKSIGSEPSRDQCFIDTHFQFNDVYVDNDSDRKDHESSENEYSREKSPEKRIQPSPSKNLNTNFKEVVLSRNIIVAAPRPKLVSAPLKPRRGVPPDGEEESGDDYNHNGNVKVVKRSENGIKKKGFSSASNTSVATVATTETKLEKQIPSTEIAINDDLPATTIGVSSRKIDFVRTIVFGFIFISVSIALISIFLVVRQPSRESTSGIQSNHYNSNTEAFDKRNDSKVANSLNFKMNTDLLSQAFKTLDGSISNTAGFPVFKIAMDLDVLGASMLLQLEELEGEALLLRNELARAVSEESKAANVEAEEQLRMTKIQEDTDFELSALQLSTFEIKAKTEEALLASEAFQETLRVQEEEMAIKLDRDDDSLKAMLEEERRLEVVVEQLEDEVKLFETIQANGGEILATASEDILEGAVEGFVMVDGQIFDGGDAVLEREREGQGEGISTSIEGEELAEEAVSHAEEGIKSLEKAVFAGRMEKMARAQFLARARLEAETNEAMGGQEEKKGRLTDETDRSNDIVGGSPQNMDLDYAVWPRGGRVVSPRISVKSIEGTPQVLTSAPYALSLSAMRRLRWKLRLDTNVANTDENVLISHSNSIGRLRNGEDSTSNCYSFAGSIGNVTVVMHSLVLVSKVQLLYQDMEKDSTPKQIKLIGWATDPSSSSGNTHKSLTNRH